MNTQVIDASNQLKFEDHPVQVEKNTQLPDLSNKRGVVLGIQGSGKSVIVKAIARSERYHFIYDVHHEHVGMNRYLVGNKRPESYKPNDPAIAELNRVVNQVVLDVGRVRMFILEEANRYCPSKRPLPSSILVLNDDQRHERVGFISVARRPTQLNSDLVELAHFLFIFRLPGKNDYIYLNEVAEGLGDAVRSLEQYHYVQVEPDRTYKIKPPVKLSDHQVGKPETMA